RESNRETNAHRLVDRSTTDARIDVEYQNATAKETRTSAPLISRRINRIRPLRISRNMTVALAPRAKTNTTALSDAPVTELTSNGVTWACAGATSEIGKDSIPVASRPRNTGRRCFG